MANAKQQVAAVAPQNAVEQLPSILSPGPTVTAAVASAPVVVTASQRKAENVLRVRADLELALSESVAANQLLLEVTAEAKAKGELVAQLQLMLHELTRMTEAEANQEYFQAQKIEREARAIAYQKALAEGRIDKKGAVQNAGFGPAPCDVAIAARVSASHQGYVRRAPGT